MKTRRKHEDGKNRIKDGAWNFTACPHPEQTEACYLYEYSLESSGIHEEITLQRERDEWREAHDSEIRAWLVANPAPRSSEDRKDWTQRASRLFPHMIATTRLSYDLHFLVSCSHFPERHWLEIPNAERSEIARRQSGRKKLEFAPASRANRKMFIRSFSFSLGNYFSNLRRAFSGFVPPADDSGDHVFSFSWQRSNNNLIEDFRQWLNENRPEDQPPLERTKASVSRRTSPRDYLNALSAQRLIRAFKGNISEACAFASDRLGRDLYSDDPAWRKAAKRAARESEDFEQRMLR